MNSFRGRGRCVFECVRGGACACPSKVPDGGAGRTSEQDPGVVGRDGGSDQEEARKKGTSLDGADV